MDTKQLSDKLLTKLRELSEKPDGWGDIRMIEPADARSILAALAPSDAAGAPEHLDNWWVDLFAKEMKEKLAAAREKGRSGWQDCDPVALSNMLREHVEKGDPRDVANFCMFLWALRAPIAAPVVPAAPTDELASMTRMFHAACADLGAINEALGLDPDDGGAEPILEAITELKAQITAPVAPAAVAPSAYAKLQSDYDALKSLCSRAETAAAEAQVELKKLRAAAVAPMLTDEQRAHLKDGAKLLRKHAPSCGYAARAIEAILAAPTHVAPVAVAPQGWKPMPPKLTTATREALVDAAREYMERTGGNSPEAMYEAAFNAAPVAPAAVAPSDWRTDLVTLINRMHKDETRGDTVFRCGFNGAIDSVVKLIEAFAAPTPTVAADAAAPINLEGLRKKLLTPRKILRDEQGFLTHPDFPICDEGTRADKFLEAFGIETRFRSMENDLPDLHERWCDEGLDDCSEWTPTPPEGDGWLLLEIYDTEDGPYALFGRDKYEAENALKRQRTRELSERIQQRAASQGDGNDQ